MSKSGEIREYGKCSKCNTRVLKIINSSIPTCRVDGIRYAYPRTAEDGSCIFRCKVCLSVIEEAWIALTTPPA